MCCSGNVDTLQWNRKWLFSRHVQFDSVFHMMATNEVSCDRPASSRAGSAWCGDGEESPSDSPRRTSCSSPRSGRSRIEVDGLWRRSPPEVLTVPAAIGNIDFSPLIGVNTSLALSLLTWISDASISSNSSMRPKCFLSRFHSRTINNRGVYLAKLLS